MISQALAARFLNQESGLSFPTYIVACVARVFASSFLTQESGFPS